MSSGIECRYCHSKPSFFSRMLGRIPRDWRFFSQILDYNQRKRIAPMLEYGWAVPDSDSYLLCANCQNDIHCRYDHELRAEDELKNNTKEISSRWPKIMNEARDQIKTFRQAIENLPSVSDDVIVAVNNPQYFCAGIGNISRPKTDFSDFDLSEADANDPWPVILKTRVRLDRTVGGENRFIVPSSNVLLALLYHLIAKPIGITGPTDFITDTYRDFIQGFATSRGYDVSLNDRVHEIDFLLRPLGKKDGPLGVWINNFLLIKKESGGYLLAVIYQYQDFRG